MNKRIQSDSTAFNVAANLFGIQKTIAADQFITVKENVPVEGSISAVYPAIIDEAFSATLDNYRKYAALKNFMCKEENDLIEQHNSAVRKFRKENKGNLTEVQIKFSQAFLDNKKNKALNPTDYNIKVEAFCQEYGMILQKRKMITLKPTAELVFQNMLVIYNQQLMVKNKRYIMHGITTPTPLEPIKINSWKVTNLKRNGIKSLDLCTKTIRNHRQRMEEFGVFQDYHFAGRNRAVEVRINPEILVIKDIFNARIASAENQRVTPRSEKKVPDDNVKLTGTSINELKRNEKVENYSQDKEFPAVMPFNLSFTRTPTCNGEIQATARAENVNVSQKYLDELISDQELAERLTRCEYNNYYPIDIRVLYSMAYAGILTRDEFYDIAMHDFFKTLQKNIYRRGNVYPGVWNIAIGLFRKQRWRLWDGNLFQPTHIADEILKMRWRIQWARKWFVKNNNVTPLFPHQYLDVTRKTSKEVGFEYTRQKWNEHDAANKMYDAKIKRMEADAVRRKQTINHAKKCETKLNSFFKNRITLMQLYDYVKNNLPQEFYDALPGMIEKKYLSVNEKTVYLENVVKYDLNDF